MTTAALERRLARVEASVSSDGCFVVMKGPAGLIAESEVERLLAIAGGRGVVVTLGRPAIAAGTPFRELQRIHGLCHEAWVEVLGLMDQAEASGGSACFLANPGIDGIDDATLDGMINWLRERYGQ